jgi:hypothetical protein
MKISPERRALLLSCFSGQSHLTGALKNFSKKYHPQVGTAGPEFLLRSKAQIFFEILFAFSYVIQ